MTLLQLEYVVAVDRYQSFSAAAQSCQIAQPTLTFQVQKLEKELNIQFFDRTTLPITTNSQGKEVIKVAKTIMANCAEIYKMTNIPLQGRTRLTGMRVKPVKKDDWRAV